MCKTFLRSQYIKLKSLVLFKCDITLLIHLFNKYANHTVLYIYFFLNFVKKIYLKNLRSCIIFFQHYCILVGGEANNIFMRWPHIKKNKILFKN